MSRRDPAGSLCQIQKFCPSRLIETRRHEGDELLSFPGDAFQRDAFVDPFGPWGRPVALATVALAHGR
jgi:hypothetical protein